MLQEGCMDKKLLPYTENMVISENKSHYFNYFPNFSYPFGTNRQSFKVTELKEISKHTGINILSRQSFGLR